MTAYGKTRCSWLYVVWCGRLCGVVVWCGVSRVWVWVCVGVADLCRVTLQSDLIASPLRIHHRSRQRWAHTLTHAPHTSIPPPLSSRSQEAVALPRREQERCLVRVCAGVCGCVCGIGKGRSSTA